MHLGSEANYNNTTLKYNLNGCESIHNTYKGFEVHLAKNLYQKPHWILSTTSIVTSLEENLYEF